METWRQGGDRPSADRGVDGSGPSRDATAAHPEVRVTRRTPECRARTVLLEAATASDLLVAGARRRTTGLGIRLGPVGHALPHHAPCPVGVVPHD